MKNEGFEAQYKNDILGDDFEQTTRYFDSDYEGEVKTTLVRKRSTNHSSKAVLYIHGFNDYFFQKELADEYIANDYHFYAVDLRKYGRSFLSHQKMNNVRNLNEYYEDIEWCLHQMRKEGNQFILLNGHSMGGLLAINYAYDHPQSTLFNALFLNSPFFELNETPPLKIVATITSKLGILFPNIKIKGGISPWYGISMHSNDKGLWNYNLLWKPHIPAKVNLGWLHTLISYQHRIQKGFTIHYPTLILHSDKSIKPKAWDKQLQYCDIILNVDDINKYAKKIKGAQVITILNGTHDLILSTYAVRKQVYKTLFSWLNTITSK